MNINETLSELDKLFANKQIDKVEDFLEEQLRFAMEEKDVNSVITLLNEMIGYQRDTSHYDKAIEYSNQVIKLMINVGLENSIYYGTTLQNVANAYRAAKRLDESLEYYGQIFKIYQDNIDENDFRYASLYNNMSLLYQEMNDYEKAVECLESALNIVRQYPDKEIQLAVTYGNLGESLLKLNRDDEALKYLGKALDIYNKDEVKDFHYSATLSAMGEAYYKIEKYDEAIKCYEECLVELEINVGHTETYDIVESNLNKVYEASGINRDDYKSDNIENTDADKDTGVFVDMGADISIDIDADMNVSQNYIKGVDLCRAYYEEYGIPMIKDKFSEYESRIAVGLVGEGSDCFGFDDEYSVDHDYGPRFCMWLDDDDYSKIGEALQEEYNKIPQVYRGILRKETKQGIGRVGVFNISEFYKNVLEVESIPKSDEEWLLINEENLAVATNGRIFRDDSGEFTEIRNYLLGYYSDSVWRLRLARESHMVAQLGQYNYQRMLDREEYVTAEMILGDYINHVMKLVYLLNKKYAPYYKWLHKGMDKLEVLAEIMDILKAICDMPRRDERIPIVIEMVATLIINEMKNQGLTLTEDNYLESTVEDILKSAVQKLSIEDLVDKIVLLEWNAFDKVQNEGGRANCQDDWSTFSLMRKSQYMTWSEDMLISYIDDFEEANTRGWNLITEKYGRMMKSTAPDKYSEIEKSFPAVSEEKNSIIEEIVRIQVEWMEEFSEKYPKAAGNTRKIHAYEDTPFDTSYETYLRGEISTYSDKTLGLYGGYIVNLSKENKNLAKMTMENTALLYGYKSLDDLEDRLE